MDIFSFLDIFENFNFYWNCGGAVSLASPIILLIGSFILFLILKLDILFNLAQKMKNIKVKNAILTKLLDVSNHQNINSFFRKYLQQL